MIYLGTEQDFYILQQGSSTFSGRGPIYILHITLRAAVTAICMDIIKHHYRDRGGRRVIGISGSLIWTKTLMELTFKPYGEFR